MLKIKNLKCGYGDIIAVQNISMNLKAGETLALTGPNGSGKTTFVMTVAGHIPQINGDISFFEKDITLFSPMKRCLEGISLVPEGRRVFPDLTVYENLLIGGISIPDIEFKNQLKNVYDIFPRLYEREKQLAGSLSGGEQQMLAIGRAIMQKPKIMLEDELSLGLMPKIVNECYNALEKLVSEGISLILIDQNSDMSRSFCDRSINLDSGYVS